MTARDFELAQMQVGALFVHDARGRLLQINEADPAEPAPRFFLVRTATGNLWRTRADLPADLAAALEHLAMDEPIVGDLKEPAPHMVQYTALLQPRGGAIRGRIEPDMILPVFFV